MRAPLHPSPQPTESPRGMPGAVASSGSQGCLQEQPCCRILPRCPPAAAPAHSHPTLSSMATLPAQGKLGERSTTGAPAEPGQQLSPCANSSQRWDWLHGSPKSPSWQLVVAPSPASPPRSLSELHHGWRGIPVDPCLRKRLFHCTPSFPNHHKYPAPSIHSCHPREC